MWNFTSFTAIVSITYPSVAFIFCLYLCRQLQRPCCHWVKRRWVLYRLSSWFPSLSHWWVSQGTRTLPSWKFCWDHSWSVHNCGSLGLTVRRLPCRPPWPLYAQSLFVGFFAAWRVQSWILELLVDQERVVPQGPSAVHDDATHICDLLHVRVTWCYFLLIGGMERLNFLVSRQEVVII